MHSRISFQKNAPGHNIVKKGCEIWKYHLFSLSLLCQYLRNWVFNSETDYFVKTLNTRLFFTIMEGNRFECFKSYWVLKFINISCYIFRLTIPNQSWLLCIVYWISKYSLIIECQVVIQITGSSSDQDFSFSVYG